MLRVRHGWDQGKLQCSVTPLGPIGGHPKSCESAEKPHVMHSSKVHFGEEKKKKARSAVTFHQPEPRAAPATGSWLGTIAPHTAAPHMAGGTTQELFCHPLAVPQLEPASPSRRYKVKSGHLYPRRATGMDEGKRLSHLSAGLPGTAAQIHLTP